MWKLRPDPPDSKITMENMKPEEATLVFEVPAGYQENERLDVYLTGFIQNATRTKVQRGIRQGRVVVNDAVTRKASQPIMAGDTIVCTLPRPPRLEITPEPMALDIVHEDEDLLVVNKPAGLVVHPAHGHRTGTLLHGLLYHFGGHSFSLEAAGDEEDRDLNDDAGGSEAAGGSEDAGGSEAAGGSEDAGGSGDAEGGIGGIPLSTVNAAPRFDGDVVLRPGIVHRIDKDTSGLLVVAKNDHVHARLADQFARHTIHRRYRALLWGHPGEAEGTIDTWLGRDPRDRRRMSVVAEGTGKHAITHYRVLEYFEYTSLVEFRLETGRTHQIRVHAKHLGRPIFGDSVYGGDRIPDGVPGGTERPFYKEIMARCPRQALHAVSIGFVHPQTGSEVYFEAEPPRDMSTVLEKIKRHEH